MTHRFRHAAAALVVGLLLITAAPALAQVAIDNTTLTNAITINQTTVTLGAITCTSCTFGPGVIIYIDNEAMEVTNAWVSGASNIPVRRGSNGTAPAAHRASATVYYGPPIRFHESAADRSRADPPIGACTRASQAFLPWINMSTGGFWLCDNTNWRVLYNYNVNGTAASR